MVLTAVLMAATVFQAVEEMDGADRRRIFEGADAARRWARWKTQELYPVRLVANERNPNRRAYLYRESDACAYVLRQAAMKQAAKAYKVKVGVMESVLDDWYLAQKYPYTPERVTAAVHDPNAPDWERKGTLFDPAKVRLPPRTARRFGYKNPNPDAEKFNRRRPSQDIKDQLLSSPNPSESPPTGASTKK